MAEAESEIPRKVALFSGHMIDGSDRKTPRFPPGREPIAALQPSPRRWPISTSVRTISPSAAARAAAAISCLRTPRWRGLRASKSDIPFEEPQFLANSVGFADGFADRAVDSPFRGREGAQGLSISPRANSARRLRVRIPTGATISGCSKPPRVSAQKSSTSSVCGMGRAATDAGGTSDMWDKVKERGGRTI